MVDRSAGPSDDSHFLSSGSERPPRTDALLELQRLLEVLFPGPPSLDCITVDDVLRRYPLTGLGAPALTAIEQSQRIVRARGDFSQTGLGEFHIGLIYFHWHDYRAAAAQFALARQPWTLAGDHSANCLARFAQGQALAQANHHEPAMLQFGRVERLLARPVHGAAGTRHAQLSEKLWPLLTTAQEGLREKLWPEDRPPGVVKGGATRPAPARHESASAGQTPPPASQAEARHESAGAGQAPPPSGRATRQEPPRSSEWAPPPMSNLHRQRGDGPGGPVPGHISVDERFGWYMIAGRRGNFLPTIAPGVWLLADSEIDERPASAHDYVVVGSSRAGLGSITAQPISHSTTLPHCYLGYRVVGPDGASQLVVDDSRQAVSGGDLLVLAVVEGFWYALDGQPAAGPPLGGING